MEHVRVETKKLKVGLYVANLDRPWLETPFLFQGFHIHDDEEIAELCKYCKSVYIDVEQSNISDADRKALLANPYDVAPKANADDAEARRRAKLLRIPEPDLSKTGQYYLDTEKLGLELERAQGVQENASRAITSMMDSVRAGQSLDVPMLEEAVDPLVDSVLRNRDAMAWLTRIRATDEYVYQHSIGSSVWAVVFGRHLGFDKETLVSVGLGGMLLDIGKTRIPAEILRKEGPLTPDEMRLMNRHVEFGLEILKETGNVDPRVACMVETHHERFNGNGHPGKLAGLNIPVLGRVAGIVDAYDAMVTQRPYAAAVSSYDAMRQLQSLANVAFQVEMVDQFVQAVGMFPTGSLVELNTGEVGVVVAQNNYQRLRPEVMVILDSEKNFYSDFKTIDLRLNNGDDMNREAIWIDRGLQTGAHGIDPSEYFL